MVDRSGRGSDSPAQASDGRSCAIVEQRDAQHPEPVLPVGPTNYGPAIPMYQRPSCFSLSHTWRSTAARWRSPLRSTPMMASEAVCPSTTSCTANLPFPYPDHRLSTCHCGVSVSSTRFRSPCRRTVEPPGGSPVPAVPWAPRVDVPSRRTSPRQPTRSPSPGMPPARPSASSAHRHGADGR